MSRLTRQLAAQADELACRARELAPPPVDVPPLDEVLEGLERLRQQMWWEDRLRGYPEMGAAREDSPWLRS